MINRVVYTPTYKSLPYSHGLYEANMQGDVRHSYTKEKVEVIETESGYILDSGAGEWFDGLKLIVVLHVTFKNIRLPIPLLKKMEMLYKGDPKEATVYNSIQKGPVGNLQHPSMPGYCFIPGFSRYAISRGGEVFSVISGKLLEPYKDEEGYLMFGVQPDVGSRTIVGMHRLLCLAWKEYPHNVSKLDINHLDAIKDNNELSNLEWATRKRNCSHAHKLGLSNSKKVMVKEVSTGKVREFYSQAEASRFLGWSSGTISNRILNHPFGRVFEGYQLKDFNDTRDWIEPLDDDHEETFVLTEGLFVVSGVDSKFIRNFRDIKDVAAYLEKSYLWLNHRFKQSGNKITVDDYLIEVRNAR